MLRIFLLAVMFIIALSPGAEATKRIGLVIGNDAYSNLPSDLQLKKAINDARAMRETLERDLGFTVFYGENADYRRMNTLIIELETATEAGDIVFVYFAGHGVAHGAENYLLPADVPELVPGEEERLTGNSFGADKLTKRLQRTGARAIFAVLDACRNNPFKTEGGRAAGGPAGLQKIDAAKGVFMLFAAGLGQVALDRLADDDPDPNSVFTRSLIPLLKQGGLSQVDLAKAVQGKVAALAAKIGHVQEPAYYDQILGFVALKEGTANSADHDATQSELFEDFEAARKTGTTDGWNSLLRGQGDRNNLEGEIMSTKAIARIAERTKVIMGRCHMDYCSWYLMLDKRLQKKKQRSFLYKVFILSGSSSHATPENQNSGLDYPNSYNSSLNVDWGDNVSEMFFFCSTRMPSYYDGDGFCYVDLFEYVGAAEWLMRLYVGICHSTSDESWSDETWLQRQGYKKIDWGKLGELKISNPNDLFALSERM